MARRTVINGDAGRKRRSAGGRLTPPSPERSRNMAAIRSSDTKPEMAVRRVVHAAGFRYRLHRSDLPGRPDLVFPRYRLVAFVHGCFWHGHQCKKGHTPRTNVDYWTPKIAANMARDERSAGKLRRAGWAVVVIRECATAAGILRLLSRLDAAKPTPPSP